MSTFEQTIELYDRQHWPGWYHNELSYSYVAESKLTNFIHITQRQKSKLFWSRNSICLQLWNYVLQAESRQPRVYITHRKLLLLATTDRLQSATMVKAPLMQLKPMQTCSFVHVFIFSLLKRKRRVMLCIQDRKKHCLFASFIDRESQQIAKWAWRIE